MRCNRRSKTTAKLLPTKMVVRELPTSLPISLNFPNLMLLSQALCISQCFMSLKLTDKRYCNSNTNSCWHQSNRQTECLDITGLCSQDPVTLQDSHYIRLSKPHHFRRGLPSRLMEWSTVDPGNLFLGQRQCRRHHRFRYFGCYNLVTRRARYRYHRGSLVSRHLTSLW